jgi:hypothetical protein
MYAIAAPDDKVDVGVIKDGRCEVVFDMKGAERVEISFHCNDLDFLPAYGKPVCDRFDGALNGAY